MLWVNRTWMAAATLQIRRYWTRLRVWAQSRVRERVTASGMGFIIATSLTGAAAFLSGNNLLFLLLAAMASLLLA
ncbi:MAG TPA: hypothetical protein PKJ41_04060, partial [Bryobacteraceae bacterium]|nr:hypothetical protein [Bryobacteraceae bacterium]